MLDYRSTIQLVRCGSRLLVIGVSQAGMTTLAEITDPVEVDYLAGFCKPSQPVSVGESFSQLFRRFQGERADDDAAAVDAEPSVVPMEDHSYAPPNHPGPMYSDASRKEAAG
jgi:hypothetical protein